MKSGLIKFVLQLFSYLGLAALFARLGGQKRKIKVLKDQATATEIKHDLEDSSNDDVTAGIERWRVRPPK